ncbi:MAG: isoprenoid biosynthesis glyoxalase ElbB [Phycisphaerales bacterium]|nr:isoprenoid biosynthesis glyoxalase ElbB [Phycisphaerales bacterium]
MAKRVAVVLSGCGRGDGSEIHESVSVLIHLSRAGLAYRCFAPDAPQRDVVNHATGEPSPAEARNQMVEAARIARGEIAPLSTLDVEAFEAVVFPGGFGAAKNLCDFALKGADCRVEPDVARVLKGFHAKKKPIALCCIAPVLAAKVLGTGNAGPGCSVTIGHDEGTAKAVAAMGATNVALGATHSHTDAANKVITTPAYMCDASPHEVFTGIGKMIDAMAAMLR